MSNLLLKSILHCFNFFLQMSEAVIYDVLPDRFQKGLFYFEVMAKNDSDEVLRPQFVDVGLARALTVIL